MRSSALPCHKVPPSPSLPSEDIQCGSKKKELGESRRNCKKEGFTVIEIWDCDWCRLYKTDTSVKEHNR